MNNQFSSKLKNHIVAFLEEKHALGYSYATEERILKQFDRFCKESYPDTETITPDLGLTWSVRKKDEKNGTFEGRISPVRHLRTFKKRDIIEEWTKIWRKSLK